MKKHLLRNISFGLLVIILVLLSLTTVVEKIYGREFSIEHIYYSWWFIITWIILCITSSSYIIKCKLYKKPSIFLLHLSFIIILTGALTSFTISKKGYIHLRQDKPLNAYISEDGDTQYPLPFEVKLVLFEIEYHPDSEQASNFMSFLQIDDGEMVMVAMNKIHSHQNYRFCQLSYDSDEMGSILLVNYDPWGIGVTYFGYFLLGLSMLWLLWTRIGWKGMICILIPLTGLWYYIAQINPMTPILRTPLLAVHVSVIMLAYFIFLVIMIISIIGICSKKRRKILFNYSSTLLQPALFLLTAGIFIGALWGNISWGRYWGWDAKETWALITMLVYAFPLHKKTFSQFSNPLVFHRYCLIAFFTVLMTFLGVSFILGGIHSYI